jgi:hypothetical protein
MRYMINVDLEAPNETGSGTDCRSELHRNLGRHFDLTVHTLGCTHRNRRSVNRPPRRFWDNNGGAGYTLQGVVERLGKLQLEHPDAHPRRCGRCGVEAYLPHWD